MSMFTKAAVAGMLLTLSATSGGTQSQPQGPESFASENAILDTGVLFAIGAREARQELRGSFGWPTFQEGLVEGVYFRFDPDGYARFSPTARLDSDVFEVVCRPRTYSCMGRKDGLSFMLNTRGQLQLKLEDVAEGDRFFIVEGVSELEVPASILQPLDTRMETLLSSSEELVVKRGPNEISRVSLVGFAAVSAYLRWIAARQDYTVLPRGWPVPTTAADGVGSTLTQATSWQSPMPQPQATLPMQPIDGVGSEVAEVRGELNVLRDLLLERQRAGTTDQATVEPLQAPSTTDSALASDGTRLAELERNTAAILAELDRIRVLPSPTQPIEPSPMTVNVEPMIAASVEPQLSASPVTDHPTMTEEVEPTAAASLAVRLEYLMTEIGLDAKTALMIIEMGSEDAPETTEQPVQTKIAETYQNKVVANILDELKAEPVSEKPQEIATPIAPTPTAGSPDYLLLSDYFRSVFTQTQGQ